VLTALGATMMGPTRLESIEVSRRGIEPTEADALSTIGLLLKSRPMVALICAVLFVTLSGATQNAPPVNDRANPYTLVGNWPQLPEGRTLGAVSGVDIDRDGSSVWIADRCGGTPCGDSTVSPILKFDAQGRL
jgi:hypothetical protein